MPNSEEIKAIIGNLPVYGSNADAVADGLVEGNPYILSVTLVGSGAVHLVAVVFE